MNYIIETSRLALRPFTMDDLQSWHQVLSDPVNTKTSVYSITRMEYVGKNKNER